VSDRTVCFFNDEFVPLGEAKVGVMTHAFNYGTGCFEGIRAYWSEDSGQLHVFRLREHLERFERSRRVLMIDLPYSIERLSEICVELLRCNGFKTDVYVRPLAYKSSELIGVRLHNLTDAFVMFAVPFGDYVETSGGLSVGVSSWRRIEDNAAPARAKLTGIYVNSALAKSEAVLNGFDESIMLTHDGHVSEGSAENIFMVSRGRLVTPPATDNILMGITRDTIITIAQDELGIETVERSIDRSELYGADEIFFCGTGAQVLPVISVDHRPIGSGTVGDTSRALIQTYMDIVHGKVETYRDWLTPVYR
jgi:branched-chain amino acid aminotransferase